MQEHETELEMAVRHVVVGRALLKRQDRILVELRADGHPTAAAEQLRSTLAQTQRLHEEHLARVLGERGRG